MRDFAEMRAADRDIVYIHNEHQYELPWHYDSCDWRFEIRQGQRGRKPAFWDYTCHAACHWLVDLNLFAAMKAFPLWEWRIITHRKHSTVWNGDERDAFLFDLNFLALGVSSKEAWDLAIKGRILKPGKFLRPFVFAPGYFDPAASVSCARKDNYGSN